MVVHVELTEPEKQLLARISFNPKRSTRDRTPVSGAAAALMRSMLDRKAIPDVRLQWFRENAAKEIGIDALEDDGGITALIANAKFTSVLRYFLDGPALPDTVIQRFEDTASQIGMDKGWTVGDMVQAAVNSISAFNLDTEHAAAEFHKLVLETPLAPMAAQIRTAILRALR